MMLKLLPPQPRLPLKVALLSLPMMMMVHSHRSFHWRPHARGARQLAASQHRASGCVQSLGGHLASTDKYFFVLSSRSIASQHAAQVRNGAYVLAGLATANCEVAGRKSTGLATVNCEAAGRKSTGLATAKCEVAGRKNISLVTTSSWRVSQLRNSLSPDAATRHSPRCCTVCISGSSSQCCNKQTKTNSGLMQS